MIWDVQQLTRRSNSIITKFVLCGTESCLNLLVLSIELQCTLKFFVFLIRKLNENLSLPYAHLAVYRIVLENVKLKIK